MFVFFVILLSAPSPLFLDQTEPPPPPEGNGERGVAVHRQKPMMICSCVATNIFGNVYPSHVSEE